VGTSLAFNVRARPDFSSTPTPVGGTATTVTLDNENVIDSTIQFFLSISRVFVDEAATDQLV
jgi:hypothetical protein